MVAALVPAVGATELVPPFRGRVVDAFDVVPAARRATEAFFYPVGHHTP
jgi:hypothetical protein